MKKDVGEAETKWKLVLGCILAALAVGVFFFGRYAIDVTEERILSSRGWPTVDGMIIESRVKTWVTQDDNGDPVRHFQAVIVYEYIVEDIHYTNDKLGWNEAGYRGSMAEAQDLADAFPMGKAVMVYYDPSDPEFSLLDATPPNYPTDIGFGYFIATGALLAFAVALIYDHFGLLTRIPSSAIITASLVLFIGSAVVTAIVGQYFAILIGFGFASFLIG